MIGWMSCLLAAYEALAKATHRATVSDYSHRWPQGLVVWGWFGWLGIHFAREARRRHW